MITNFNNFLLLERKINIELMSKDDNWWNNFIKKLLLNEPFYIDDFEKVTVKNPKKIYNSIIDIDTGKVDKQKAYNYFTSTGKKGGMYKHNIELSNGEKIGLNDLERTWEFGSSPGTSTGTKQTRVNESIQAIYLSIRQKKKSPIIKDDILNFIKEYKKDTPYALSIYKKIGTDVKISIDDLDAERGWMDTHLLISNMLFDYLDDENKYVFYQSFYSDPNALPVILRNKFYELIRKETDVDVDIAKWNPSDVFCVVEDKETKIINKINDCYNIDELNYLMDYLFDKKYLVGISLKKVDINREVRFIINKEETSKFKYLYSTTSLIPTASMSVNIYVEADSTIPTSKEQIMTARIYTGDKESDMMLEIKGSDSKYGKAGMRYLNDILRKVGLKEIPYHNDIYIKNLTNEDIIKKLEEYYDKLDMGKTITKTDRYDISDTRSKLIGKLQSLILIDILESNKNVRYIKPGFIGTIMSYFRKVTKSDYVVKQLFYYAYAMGNEIFENCKYFRISNF